MNDLPARHKGLGRGLAALLGEAGADEGASARSSAAERLVPIELLVAGRLQPRRRFDDAEIDSLAASIREKGVLQPLLVRPSPQHADTFEIIAGERRWRAAQRAGLHQVPVVLRDLTDAEALEFALVENLQREDLTPLEEAEAYQRLMTDFGHTQRAVAQSLGKSRSHVANMIRLLSLPDPVKAMLQAGELSMGHARALLPAPDALSLAREIKARGLNVRQTERLARRPARAKARSAAAADPNILEIERDLTTHLGLKVTIKPRGERGDVTIAYENLEQFDDIFRRLTGRKPS